MTPICLVDSDVLSQIARGEPRVTKRASAYIEAHGRLTISAISVFERLRGYRLALRRGKPFEKHLRAFAAFSAACMILPVDAAVADRAAVYWAALPARSRNSLGDILVAATAASAGVALVTRNTRDFAPIAALDGDLQVIDWSR